MALTRSDLREKIMIILYQIDINKERNIDYDVKSIIKSNLEIANDFVENIVMGVCENQQMLDDLANQYIKDWSIERIDKTGAAILRMALYEIKFTDTPSIVVINEAVELAKKYSDESVRKIINAVLDKVIDK